MAGSRQRTRLLRVLSQAGEQLELWRHAVKSASAHLSAMVNLCEQLESLQRCERGGGSLGVLGRYPVAVSVLLRGKLVQCMERAMDSVQQQKLVLLWLYKWMFQYYGTLLCLKWWYPNHEVSVIYLLYCVFMYRCFDESVYPYCRIVMMEVVKKLKKITSQGRALFRDIVGTSWNPVIIKYVIINASSV